MKNLQFERYVEVKVLNITGREMGCVYGHYEKNKEHGKVFYIAHLAVKRKYRRQGIGRQLLEMIPPKVYLEAEEQDNVLKENVILFYKACGFKHICFDKVDFMVRGISKDCLKRLLRH
jgi:ribosomal protein S18 acetylase RimI-like enzyme